MAPATTLGAGLVRLLAWTWRIEQRDHPEFTAAKARGEKVLYCFWHSGLLPLVHSHRGEGIAVLVSQHRDGELVTRLIEPLFMTVIGLLIGVIVVLMYFPIFQLAGSVQ